MESRVVFLSAFVSVLAIHAWILYSYKVTEMSIILPPQKTIAPTINLQRVAIKVPPIVTEEVIEPTKASDETKPEPKKKTVSKKSIVPQPKKEKKPFKVVKKKKLVKKKSKQPKKHARKPSTARRSSSPQTKAAKRHYLQKVKMTIERNKSYPRTAKRMRQEGSVTVRFEIMQNGKIRNIRIVSRSRHKRLDKAATGMLRKIAAFDPIPRELNKRSMTITVPINYQIID